MPRAGGNIAAQIKYAYMDYDTDVVDEEPPVQNTWYEVFDAEDVRLLLVNIRQDNDETDAKTVEMRWTIDGNVYLGTRPLPDTTREYAYRSYQPSTLGTLGITISGTALNAMRNLDKRGHAFKVEVRITDVPGTNQRLRCWAIRETLEET